MCHEGLVFPKFIVMFTHIFKADNIENKKNKTKQRANQIFKNSESFKFSLAQSQSF